ncbi:ribosomal protein S18 acetylase RimI-like enzyme [Parvibaculum indicum]|uniref:GNAT family acetyltransferase n=1 Tax=Parvibaculum indicum TaxID=562969 RepID=UPI0014241ECD|nr:GNAT family acetyltransferase [Parvibaculum indicum]NIJ42603.1 ribosomal protein S18 acetylase RimI-like enzyme [Parvibaculum indicum]
MTEKRPETAPETSNAEDFTLREATLRDAATLDALWQAAGLTRPFNDSRQDIGFALSGPASTILLLEREGHIGASVMVGYDGHRGTVYYVSADPGLRHLGLGTRIMRAAEDWLTARGVWKLNLMIRPENEGVRRFYETLGYEVEERIVMSRRLGD